MNKTIYSFLVFISLSTLVSAQSGITWGMGMNVNTSATGNLRPRITTDGAGNPVIIWGKSSDESCYISLWNGTAFTTPMKVNPTSMTIAAMNWEGPEIASKGDTVYVVMKETPEGDLTSKSYITRSVDGGMSFSAPVMLDNFPDSLSRFPTVTVDANGNPIVGYMKFNSTFGDARWVVAKSTNLGNTFSTDVKASGYSAMGASVCDCCPGGLTCTGNNIAMMYRDNNSNIRDTWAGISTDGGSTFPSGMALDMENWMLMMCPSSGPDGVFIGDTLYSTYMNGAGGTNKVYFSKASVSAMTNTAGTPITGTIAGLTQQNYPRIANSDNAVAVVWKQIVNGESQLLLRFSENITNGLSAVLDTVDVSNITNTDVALANGKIYIVWEDDGSGTVKFRSGTYAVPNSISVVNENEALTVYPNPAGDYINLDIKKIPGCYGYSILDISGKIILKSDFKLNSTINKINVSGLTGGTYMLQPVAYYYQPAPIKFIVHQNK